MESGHGVDGPVDGQRQDVGKRQQVRREDEVLGEITAEVQQLQHERDAEDVDQLQQGVVLVPLLVEPMLELFAGHVILGRPLLDQFRECTGVVELLERRDGVQRRRRVGREGEELQREEDEEEAQRRDVARLAPREILLRQESGFGDEIAQGGEELRVDVGELVKDVVREVRNTEVVMPRLPLAAAGAIDVGEIRIAVRTLRERWPLVLDHGAAVYLIGVTPTLTNREQTGANYLHASFRTAPRHSIARAGIVSWG